MKLETLERLVALKSKHPRAISLVELKPQLEQASSEDEEDALVNQYIDETWQGIIIRAHLIEVLKRYLQRPEIRRAGIRYVGLDTIIGLYFGSNPPQGLSPEQLRNILLELSSPIKGFLGRDSLDGEGDRFYVLRDYVLG